MRGQTLKVRERYRSIYRNEVVIVRTTGRMRARSGLLSRSRFLSRALRLCTSLLWQKCSEDLLRPQTSVSVSSRHCEFRSFTRPPVISSPVTMCLVVYGALLQVWGPDSGGDVTELRLKSTPATDDADATVVNLRAYGGSLDFENTKVKV